MRQYGNEREDVWLLKDNENGQYGCIDAELLPMMSLVAQNNILIYLVDTSKFKRLAEMKHILSDFANKIDIVNMNNIPMKKTIELMKNENGLQKKIAALYQMTILLLVVVISGSLWIVFLVGMIRGFRK